MPSILVKMQNLYPKGMLLKCEAIAPNRSGVIWIFFCFVIDQQIFGLNFIHFLKHISNKRLAMVFIYLIHQLWILRTKNRNFNYWDNLFHLKNCSDSAWILWLYGSKWSVCARMEGFKNDVTFWESVLEGTGCFHLRKFSIWLSIDVPELKLLSKGK